MVCYVTSSTSSRREKVSGTVYWRLGGCGYNPVMGRPNRAADGGLIFHVLNRGNARFTISEKLGEEAKRFLTPFFPSDTFLPLNWVRRVNEPLIEKESETVRWSIKRGSPFGNETMGESTARRLDLESTLRPRVRPRIRQSPNNDS